MFPILDLDLDQDILYLHVLLAVFSHKIIVRIEPRI